MSSKLKKILGNVCDYFTGFGSGNYTETINFYTQYLENDKIEISSSKIDQTAKVAIRTGLSLLELALVYRSIKDHSVSPLQPIIPSELFRLVSIYFDRRNIKRIRKEKEKAKYQSLEEINQEFNKKIKLNPKHHEGEEWKNR